MSPFLYSLSHHCNPTQPVVYKLLFVYYQVSYCITYCIRASSINYILYYLFVYYLVSYCITYYIIPSSMNYLVFYLFCITKCLIVLLPVSLPGSNLRYSGVGWRLPGHDVHERGCESATGDGNPGLCYLHRGALGVILVRTG